MKSVFSNIIISCSLSVCFSSSESETEMRLSTAQNLLTMFRPRSKSEQDKVRLLSNLCRIHSKETKQVERAVQELTDMMSENVRLDLIGRVIAMILKYSLFTACCTSSTSL